MNGKQSRKILFPALLLGGALLSRAAAAAGGEFPIRQFQSPEDFAGWRGEGVETGGPAAGGLQVLGGERFQLYPPAGPAIPAGAKAYLRVRLRVQSPRYFLVLGQNREGLPAPASEPVQPPLDSNFHTFWVSLAEGAKPVEGTGVLAIAFGGRPGWVELDSFEIRPFSVGLYLRDQWREFLLPRRLGLGSINSLNSPRIFGRSVASWLNILAVAIFLVAVLFYRRARGPGRRRIVLRTALILLAVWVLYDVRESYSQYQTLQGIHDTYVKPPPGEKTFPTLGRFLGFVDLCRKVIPETAQYHFYSTPMWPFDCRIQYFLYPRGIESSTWNRYIPEKKTPYHAIYQNPSIQLDRKTGRLIRRDDTGENFISRPGSIRARFDASSYIFLEDEVN